MPELPEVETTKTSLKPLLNKKVEAVSVFQPKLRWPIAADVDSLQGYVLQDIERRAKYLILKFTKHIDSDSKTQCSTASKPEANSETNPETKPKTSTKALIIHLGMSGSLQQYPVGTEKRKHDHLIMLYDNDPASDPNSTEQHTTATGIQLHYHDPRRFGAILWLVDYEQKLLAHLGAEPLDDEFTGDYLYHKIHRTHENKTRKKQNKTFLKPITRPIKAVIMDQTFVVGVGNIYATESLFMAGIHPSTPANKLTKKQLSNLTQYIREILQRAITQGGSTLRDFTVASGTTGYFQQTLLVYGKHNQPCPKCATPIEKVTITGRASTFCPKCQPLAKGK